MNGLTLRGFVATLLLLAGAGSAPAQFWSNLGTPTGVNPAFLSLLAPGGSFTATLDTVVYDAAGKEWARLPLAASFTTNKLRLDVQLDQVKSRDLPDFMIASLKATGMGSIAALVLPEKGASWLIYPGFQCSLAMPLTEPEKQLARKPPVIEKKAAGTETVEGRECSRQTVTVRSGGHSLLEATVWENPELKGVPARVEIPEPGRRMVLTFKDVRHARAPAGEFALPAGYTQYTNYQAMMFGIMKRIAGTGDTK